MSRTQTEPTRYVDRSADPKIVNLDALPLGTGARFLEVTESHIPGTYIAAQWRRKAPATLPVGHLLMKLVR